VEKIQQALEKARRIRADALQQPRSDGGGAGRQPNAGGNGSAASSSPYPTATATGELRIDYERTRVVDTAPEVLRRNRIVAATREDSGAFEAFRILRTQVLARLEARNGNAIAICGAGQGEGKTLVAVNLAVSMARQPHRSALLVDLDLRNPSVHRCFDLTPEYGLSDYLAGRVPLEECLVNPGIERLVLLPQRERIPQSSELLGLRRMAALAQELKARYRDRIIVYDCPPLLVTDDPLVTMDYADGCLLVVREGKTQRAELLRAAELVGEDRFLGTVLNDARWATASGYYYYGYGY
jgi:protein-tyrosine kinase